VSEYIQQLRDAILKTHGVESTHIESVPVKETHKGQTVWEGAVEVFQLWRHPKADYAYAWAHGTDDGRLRHVAVLKVHPIQSASDAVRAAIVEEFKSLDTAEES
jgi:hypothetical protein